MAALDILRRPVITEKSTIQRESNRYAIEVAPSATKAQIREAIESRFKVEVEDVHTVTVRGKFRRKAGPVGGYKSDWKKALVKVKAGQQIKWEEVA